MTLKVMPVSSKKILMRVRDRLAKEPFLIDNFDGGGWKVRNKENTGWLKMNPSNVRIRNPEHDPNKHDIDDKEFPLWLEPTDRRK